MIPMRKIIFFLPLLFSCSLHNETLFHFPALQDSLEVFISHIESIPNPYNAPTIINVNIGHSPNNDTLITFIAHYGLVYPVDDQLEMTGQIYGGTRMKNRIVVVHFDDHFTFYDILNTELLNLKENEYDFFRYYRGERFDIKIPPLSRRGYMIKNGALIEVERQRGRYEK